MSIQIRRLNADETLRAAPALGEVLKDCVDGGASVSFMADLTLADAAAFWETAAAAQVGDGRAVVVAEDDDGPFGVVQVIPAGTPNQPHRGDVAKMLVHRRGRRRGAAQALLAAAEQAGR
ncbi:MAG: GNAT family N-acetyltransferase, partial [Phenylobacterium sp.]